MCDAGHDKGVALHAAQALHTDSKQLFVLLDVN